MTLTLVAGAVAVATSLMNAASVVRISVDEKKDRAELLAEALYHQASGVLRRQSGGSAGSLANALATDPSLTDYVEAVVGYSPTTLYLAISDHQGKAILHSTPGRQGTVLSQVSSLADFSTASSFDQFWTLLLGRRVLEVGLPFTVDGRPFGAVRVAISTVLLRKELTGAIARNTLLAASVVLAVFLASFYIANRLLAPIEMLRRELARIDPGRGEPPLDLRNEEDVNRVAEFFAMVSQRMVEDKSLRDEESSWMDTMLGGLSDAIMVVSKDSKILTLNAPACLLMGCPRSELQGQDLGSVLAEGHPISRLVEDSLSSEQGVGPLSVSLAVNGRTVLHTLSAQILRENHLVSGVMVTARDMDKLQRVGDQLSYSQKLASLGKLTSGVAHEIKNPLNAMVIHVALLRQKISDRSPAQGYLDVLEEEIRRLDSVIQGFLKFTRPEELRFESIPLNEVLEEVIRLVSADAERKGIQLEPRFATAPRPAYGDRELLQQAFLNVMLNACEAMPAGGRLAVTTQTGSDGRHQVEFEDTGVGIPPDQIAQVFDLYFTTKERGSGIGLSMVYRIVQLHDGDVSIESTPGEGTRFTIRLPEAPL